MHLVTEESKTDFTLNIRTRVLQQNEQSLTPTLAILTCPMTRKIVQIYTDDLSAHQSSFIVLRYPDPAVILKMFEGREWPVQETDYDAKEDELQQCRNFVYQFWSVNFDKFRQIHLNNFLIIYLKGSLIYHTQPEIVQEIVCRTGEKSRGRVLGYMKIRDNLESLNTSIREFPESCIPLDEDYFIKQMTMKEYYEARDELIYTDYPMERTNMMKVGILFGFCYGLYTKSDLKLVGRASMMYCGESAAMYVHSKHRGKGLGRALGMYTYKRIHMLGVHTFTLVVDKQHNLHTKFKDIEENSAYLTLDHLFTFTKSKL